jgi:hypothetical protein
MIIEYPLERDLRIRRAEEKKRNLVDGAMSRFKSHWFKIHDRYASSTRLTQDAKQGMPASSAKDI